MKQKENINLDQAAKEMDRQWNCMKNTPLEFNQIKFKETKRCIKK